MKYNVTRCNAEEDWMSMGNQHRTILRHYDSGDALPFASAPSRSPFARVGRRLCYVGSESLIRVIPSGDTRLRFLEVGRRMSGSKVGVGIQRHFFNSLGYREPVMGWTETKGGFKLFIDTRDIIERTILIRGEWEPTISYTLRAVIRRGDHVVDVGAHVGHHSLLAATVTGDAGKVWAIEPNPSTFQRLLRNLDANGSLPVLPLMMAVSDTARELQIVPGPPGNSGMTQFERPSEQEISDPNATSAERSPAGPLDEIVPEAGFGHPLVVKVDIEGAESTAVSGLRRLLDRAHPSVGLLVESHYGSDRRWLRQLQEDLGLVVFGLANPGGLSGQYPNHRPQVCAVSDLDTWPGSDLALLGAGLLNRVNWQSARGSG